jgi:hypothetical protein
MGWALGAILYEINEYPWALQIVPGEDPAGVGGWLGQSWVVLALVGAAGKHAAWLLRL